MIIKTNSTKSSKELKVLTMPPSQITVQYCVQALHVHYFTLLEHSTPHISLDVMVSSSGQLSGQRERTVAHGRCVRGRGGDSRSLSRPVSVSDSLQQVELRSQEMLFLRQQGGQDVCHNSRSRGVPIALYLFFNLKMKQDVLDAYMCSSK